MFVVEVWSLQRAVPFDGVMKAGNTLQIEDQEGPVASEAHLTSYDAEKQPFIEIGLGAEGLAGNEKALKKLLKQGGWCWV